MSEVATKLKSGRFSQSELDEVKKLHEKGKKPEFIANKLNRGVDNIKKILNIETSPAQAEKKAKEPKKSAAASSNGVAAKTEEAPKKAGRPAGSTKASSESKASGETVCHDFWIRKNMMVRITLPMNLTKAEAESLAAKIANCAFV